MENKLDLNNIRALIIDMDGVLWRGNTPLPGLTRFFDFLYNCSISFILATNNASRTPAQYQQRLANFGVTIKPENVLTSALATVAYLNGEFNRGRKAYVVGQDGIREALRSGGFTVVEDSSQPVDVVVASMDFHLTYEKLEHAAFLIQRGARYIGTNGDLTFPTEGGLSPGAGSILAALQAATGVEPVVIGKPEPFIFEIAVQKMGTQPGQTAMLGDRLETDILGAQRAGLKTILVTTGIDNRDSITQKGIQPDAIFSGLDDLVDVWPRRF
jgi:4-nitrophenyl phosphatase